MIYVLHSILTNLVSICNSACSNENVLVVLNTTQVFDSMNTPIDCDYIRIEKFDNINPKWNVIISNFYKRYDYLDVGTILHDYYQHLNKPQH